MDHLVLIHYLICWFVQPSGKRLRSVHAEGLCVLPVVSREVFGILKSGKQEYRVKGFIKEHCSNVELFQNAYTATAINSTNFCTSACDAFVILVENALRVAAINTVGDFVLFLGKVPDSSYSYIMSCCSPPVHKVDKVCRAGCAATKWSKTRLFCCCGHVESIIPVSFLRLL